MSIERTGIWRLKTQGEYATEPSLIEMEDNTLLLSWTGRDAQAQERIYTTRATTPLAVPEEPCPSDIVSARGVHAWSSLVRSNTHTWVIWTEKVEPKRGNAACARIWVRPLSPLHGEARIVRQTRAVRGVSAEALGGVLWITAGCETHSGHSVDILRVEEDGTLEILEIDPHPRALRVRPTLCLHKDTPALTLVWEAHRAGGIELHTTCVERQFTSSSPAPVYALPHSPGTFEQHPSIVPTQRGVWLVFATDSRAPGIPPDLARCVRLRYLQSTLHDAPKVWNADDIMPGVDLDASGEDQSLEFPQAIYGNDGGLWIFARASHATRCARFGNTNTQTRAWSTFFELSPTLWGCRGLRLAGTPLQQGGVALGVHERKGIEIHTLRSNHWNAPSVPPEDTCAACIPLHTLDDERPVPKTRISWTPQGTSRERTAFLGDIHYHSARSDGVGTIEEAYIRTRDRYGDDFTCITDHDGFIGRRVTSSVWRDMVDIGRSFNEPGSFATLIGIEFTGVRYPGPGHKCLYFPDEDVPVVCRWDDLQDSPALLEKVRELGGIAIPHHIGWLGGDVENHDSALQPCWEVCSTHGQYEAWADDPNPAAIEHRLGLERDREGLKSHIIRTQLARGQVFGFVGGSDGHGLLYHHGVGRARDSHRTGLTGVWTESLERREIFDCIRARRTWATSGAKIVLGFSLGEAWMGEQLPYSLEDGVLLEIRCEGTAPIHLMEVFATCRDGVKCIHSVKIEGQKENYNNSIALQNLDHLDACGCVYVRVTQEDGEMAWGSPIFYGSEGIAKELIS